MPLNKGKSQQTVSKNRSTTGEQTRSQKQVSFLSLNEAGKSLPMRGSRTAKHKAAKKK